MEGLCRECAKKRGIDVPDKPLSKNENNKGSSSEINQEQYSSTTQQKAVKEEFQQASSVNFSAFIMLSASA